MKKSRTLTIIIGFFVPMSAILLAFPFYNRIEPFVLGYSFNYFWIFAWQFLTALCLFIAYKSDPYNKPETEAASLKALNAAKAELEKADKIGKAGSSDERGNA